MLFKHFLHGLVSMSNSDEKKSTCNIQEYISGKIFVIPNYQRGYKWGVPPEKKDGKATCSVKFLLECIIDAQKKSKDKKDDKKKIDYFIQGVTVTENNGEVVLIDGQQRTTTLYLLLKYLGYDQLPTIKYDIRKETHNFLKDSFIENGELKSKHESNESQDIFYLNKAMKTIHSELNEYSDDSKMELRQYILENVKLFYITIDKNEATKVFSMLNGQKAEMKQAELIKAELLRLISKNEECDSGNQQNNGWEINQARSKYAREWDRWNYWWNREEVKSFYEHSNNEPPIDFLLKDFIFFNNEKLEFSFKNFKDNFLADPKLAKSTFKKLREHQKTFEDWFNNVEKHNYLGLIIKCHKIKNKEVFKYLRDKKEIRYFKKYATWAILGLEHEEIMGENSEQLLKQEADKVFSLLKEKKVYHDKNNQEDKDNKNIEESHKHAYRQLLRRNVDMDTQLGRRFDFSIWSSKSLEHIHPQSKPDELEWTDDLSVHCIGNLVLLYIGDNSSFSNLPFNDKKNKLFNPNKAETKEKKPLIKSISLLHTVSVFSNNQWGIEQIKENRDGFLREFSDTYELGEK